MESPRKIVLLSVNVMSDPPKSSASFENLTRAHHNISTESEQYIFLMSYDNTNDFYTFFCYVIKRDFGWVSLYHFLLKPSFI